jgi:hypothetical protein
MRTIKIYIRFARVFMFLFQLRKVNNNQAWSSLRNSVREI